MRRRSRALTLFALMASLGACEGLVDKGAPAPPNGSSGTGGAAGSAVDPDAGVVVDPTGSGGAVGSGGSSGTGGSVTAPDGGAGGAGGGPPASSPCGDYPAGPALTATKFEVGSVVPNLTFKREDGTSVSFGDLRCNKNNKVMYWTVGGDNCPPCVATAKSLEIPANAELGPKGLLIVASFNGKRFLVSKTPWTGWRTKTMWPADSDTIAVVDEPTTMPYYVHGRIVNAIPWTAVIDLETMKVLATQTRSATTLRSLVAAAPARP